MKLDGAFANERWTQECNGPVCPRCECSEENEDPNCDCECHYTSHDDSAGSWLDQE